MHGAVVYSVPAERLRLSREVLSVLLMQTDMHNTRPASGPTMQEVAAVLHLIPVRLR